VCDVVLMWEIELCRAFNWIKCTERNATCYQPGLCSLYGEILPGIGGGLRFQIPGNQFNNIRVLTFAISYVVTNVMSLFIKEINEIKFQFPQENNIKTTSSLNYLIRHGV